MADSVALYARLVHAIVVAIGAIVALTLLLVALPVQALLFVLTRPFDATRRVPGRFLRMIGVLLGACYPRWRLRLDGAWPSSGGAHVVVSNHQSMLDIVLLSRIGREMKWVAKDELFRVPWIGWLLWLAGDIPVRRGDSESGGAALTRAREYLERGVSVVFFPEGTRSRTGELLAFKSGAFRLAIAASVPVLPIAISGTLTGLAKGGARIAPCDAVGRVLEPVSTRSMGPDQADALAATVRARIAESLARA
jgi:1-acyl-sn-glycerol-3-phosphate acyltransferase